MSLVAAYSDSESENESEEKINPAVSLTEEKINVLEKVSGETSLENDEDGGNFDIEDEDDWQVSTKQEDKQTGEIFSNLPAPAQKSFSLTEEVEDEFLKKKVTKEDALFKKEQELLKKEEEEEKGKKISSNLLSKFKKGGKKKNQPIKISIPTLAEIGADSDSDNEEQAPKPERISASKKSSALFSMLPKPKNSITVGNNRNRVFVKETNRTLIPHTLTKKKEEPAKTKNELNVKKNTSLVADVGDSDDEEDEDISSNFFSFEDSSVLPKETITKTIQKSDADVNILSINKKVETDVKQTVPQKKGNSKTNISLKSSNAGTATKSNAFFANLFKNKKTSSASPASDNTAHEEKHVVKPQNTPKATIESSQSTQAPITAPLVEKPAPQTSYGVTAPYGAHATTNQTDDMNTGVTAPYGSYGGHQQNVNNGTNQNFFYYSHETPAGGNFQHPHQQQLQLQQHEQEQHIDYYNQPNEDTPIDREALQALQGRKRRHEEINLIDVNAQDLQTDSEEYLRNLTVDSGYKPKQAKGFGPSGQQKRKHQITYLAFQAKEREFELRQSWADSNASKKQTQSRYGF